jgi:hypothetical protein
MGVHGALVAGIPGLKSETWGTLRVFPTRCVQAIMYGLKAVPFRETSFSGVMLSKLSKMLNQEDALSGPCLRGDGAEM